MPAQTHRKRRATATERPPTFAAVGADPMDYWVDVAQRSALFLDTLLDRGNNYVEHLENGTPPLLKFEFETVLDGRDLPKPCNYALLRFLAPADLPV